MPLQIVDRPQPGCIAEVTALHARYYGASHGFGLAFEARVATELAAFCLAFTPGRDGLWLAVDGGRVLGSIAIDGSHAATHGAHLRWFITAEALRGLGAGRLLLDTALAFCDAQAFDRVFLWTFAGLDAARHLYEARGFRLDHAALGRHWGTEVTEQRFTRQRR